MHCLLTLRFVSNNKSRAAAKKLIFGNGIGHNATYTQCVRVVFFKSTMTNMETVKFVEVSNKFNMQKDYI